MKIITKYGILFWLLGFSICLAQAPTSKRRLITSDIIRLPSDSISVEKGMLNNYYYHSLKMRNNQNFNDAIWWLDDPVVRKSYRLPCALRQMSFPLALIGIGNMMSLTDSLPSTTKTISTGIGYVALAGAMQIAANKLSIRTVRIYNERLVGETLGNRNLENYDTVRTYLGTVYRYSYHGMGLYTDKNVKDVLLRFGDRYIKRDYDFSKGMNTLGTALLGAGIPMMMMPMRIKATTNYWDSQLRNVTFTGIGLTLASGVAYYFSNRMLDWAVEKYNREVRLRRAIAAR